MHLLPTTLLLTACGAMAIDGQVIDADGAPITGATISAMPATTATTDAEGNVRVDGAGRICQARSDAEGRFSLECLPNTYDIVVAAEGYTSEDFTLEAPERKRYDAGRQLLVKIPEEKGLFLKQGTAYATMAPGHLARKTEKKAGLIHRRFCLDEDSSQPTELAAGVHAFFDHEHEGWRPFRLDEDGCAYRDTKDGQHRWTVQYREKAAYRERELNRGRTVALMELPAGDYFIADWKGFFQKSADRSETDAYTGFWLKVR